MTEFTERYKTLSNIELLKILDEQENYQKIAVETAKIEIENRKLSDHELKLVKPEISKQQVEKKNNAERRTEREEKLKSYGETFIETINPIQNQAPGRIILFITIIFSGISIYQLYKEFSIIRYVFTGSHSDPDLSMIVYLFPLIILPIATYLFWKRKKTGWILLSIFLTYSAMNAIVMFFISLGEKQSGLGILETLFPSVSPMLYLPALVFFSGSLWVISKKEIRDVYNLNRNTLFKVIGLTIIINGVSILSIIS